MSGIASSLMNYNQPTVTTGGGMKDWAQAVTFFGSAAKGAMNPAAYG